MHTKFKKIALKKVGAAKPISWITHILFLIIGIWAGIIVLDTATFILFTLTIHLGVDLLESNAIKSAVCLIILIVASFIFYIEGQIIWSTAILLSIGSYLGGYLGSKLAMSEKSRVWLFRLLISVIIFEIISMLYSNIST